MHWFDACISRVVMFLTHSNYRKLWSNCSWFLRRNWAFLFNLPPRCPPGHMVRVNGTKKTCVYTLCATRPCHRGTCVAQSPSKFTCHCPDGYRGRHCETTLAIYREDVGLSFSSLFAICICFMALLGIYARSPVVSFMTTELKKTNDAIIDLIQWFSVT